MTVDVDALKVAYLTGKGWKPWPIYVDPIKGTIVHIDVAVAEQLERDSMSTTPSGEQKP
jgi:hypothetical protein